MPAPSSSNLPQEAYSKAPRLRPGRRGWPSVTFWGKTALSPKDASLHLHRVGRYLENYTLLSSL